MHPWIKVTATAIAAVASMLANISMSAAAETPAALQATSARLRMSYESVKLPANERMGLLGGSFLYDLGDRLSMGPAAYGSVNGQRGGFITLGLAADLRFPLSDTFDINGGMFLGAGGGHGGFMLQGGGLMLRSHLGLTLKSANWGNLAAGASYVDFPNGSIHSMQPYLAYEYPFKSLLTYGWPDLDIGSKAEEPGPPVSRQEFSLVYRHYRIPKDVVSTTGAVQHPKLQLLGVEWQHYLDDRLFVKIESEGAMGGQSNGYMQIFLGGGYRLPITASTALKFSASAGAAGGGRVTTGGGLLVDVSAGLQQDIGRSLFLELTGSYVKSPAASFRATSLAAKLGYRYGTPAVDRDDVPVSSLNGFSQRKMRLRFVQQSYLKDAPNWRNHHANLNVHTLGFQGDWFVAPYLYLSGQGIAAWKGQAGGYMTGLVGAGLHLPIADTALFIELEGLVGAAGGGGLDVAGGLVWQSNANLGYRFSDAYSLQGSYGYMAAPKGNFRAKVVGLSLAYHFSFFTKSATP